MEEVDNILLINLKELGVIGSDEDIKNLSEIKPDQVYQACITCLSAIDSSKAQSFPQSLPRGTSVKVNVTSELANVIKGLGYKGDLGYHQIMYPNNDTKKLLMWLIDSMPKKTISNEGGSGDSGSSSSGKDKIRIEQNIIRELMSLLQFTWSPLFTLKSLLHSSSLSQQQILQLQTKYYINDSYKSSAKKLLYPNRGRKVKQIHGLEKYYAKYNPLLTSQTKYRKELSLSIFESNLSAVSEQKERENEWNSKGLGSNMNPVAYAKKKSDNILKAMAAHIRNALSTIDTSSSSLSDAHVQSALRSQFGRKKQFTTEEGNVNINEMVKLTEEEVAKKRQAELETLTTELATYEKSKEDLSNHIKALNSNIVQLEALLKDEELKTQKLEKEYLIKKRTFDLLPNAEANILQLQEISTQSSNRIVELAREWEKYRTTLVEEFRKLKSLLANSEEETKVKIEKIKVMRQQMKEIADEIRSKDEKIREKVKTYNEMQKDTGRTYYTDRILDIVKSVKKQKAEIDKTLLEIRTLHKEINSTSETLNRTFLEIDEMVFQDAKKNDPTAKDAYKHIVTMNENFKKLIKNIEEIGGTQNGILTLETKLKQMEDRTNSYDFKRIEQDLKDMKAENMSLLDQIQQKSLGLK